MCRPSVATCPVSFAISTSQLWPARVRPQSSAAMMTVTRSRLLGMAGYCCTCGLPAVRSDPYALWAEAGHLVWRHLLPATSWVRAREARSQ